MIGLINSLGRDNMDEPRLKDLVIHHTLVLN